MVAHKKRMPLVAPASVPNGIRSLVHQSLEEQDWGRYQPHQLSTLRAATLLSTSGDLLRLQQVVMEGPWKRLFPTRTREEKDTAGLEARDLWGTPHTDLRQHKGAADGGRTTAMGG